MDRLRFYNDSRQTLRDEKLSNKNNAQLTNPLAAVAFSNDADTTDSSLGKERGQGLPQVIRIKTCHHWYRINQVGSIDTKCLWGLRLFQTVPSPGAMKGSCSKNKRVSSN